MLNILFLIARAAEVVIPAGDINPNVPGVTGGGPLDIIAGFYKFALGISGFLAIAVIVYGAIKYATNAGNAGNLTDAKEWIYSALLGMLLLAGAYIILSVINPDLTILRLPLLNTIPVITTPTSSSSLATVYAVVEQKIIDTNFANENDCKTVCNGSDKTCVKNKDNALWSCTQNTPMPSTQCSRTLDACSAKKTELSGQNPSKYYDCVAVYSNRTAWCSSTGLEPIPTADKCATGNCVKIDFSKWITVSGGAVDPKMYDVLSCIAGSGFDLRVTEAMPPTVIHSSVRHNNGCAVDVTWPLVKTAADCSKVCELTQTATACGSPFTLNEYFKLCGSATCKGQNTEHSTGDHVHIEASCGK